ncbi:MAG: TA system VapC family ribonuclease toxin [Burkholderiaceae bacterium]
MKLPDTNVLVNSVNAFSPSRLRATAWLEGAFDADGGIGFAWLALVGFVRISTQRGILQNPLAAGQALELMDTWLSHPRARILQPTERHADIFARLLLSAGTAGTLTNDAHLAALAIEHNATLGTFDKDFKRFPNVKFDLLTPPP